MIGPHNLFWSKWNFGTKIDQKWLFGTLVDDCSRSIWDIDFCFSQNQMLMPSGRYKPFATSISKIIRNIFLKVKTLVSCHPRKDRKRCVCGWMDAVTLPCWAWMAGAWSGLMAMSGNGLKPSIQRCRRQSRSNVVNGCGEAQNLLKVDLRWFRCVG